ncbi:hypothetical protein Bpfe_004047 [Biomphalaria pfeifferi]|uniref:Uncharacterized protein n=1 Tax=Biomphalaria pfeifferi TaxID=112525 RepID=A0AAD8C731_BIOPF|nr:hypothetical protein Bpfe_004047 [Biomphalaria pfeifferi]
MAASCTQPVVVPENYFPAFKVEVLLHAPIQVYQTSEADLHIDLMMLCYQLDTICKQGLAKSPETKRASILRNSKATLVYNNIQQVLFKLLKSTYSGNIASFPIDSGLEELFPRVSAYMAGNEHLISNFKSTAVDEYFSQLSSMHHLLSLSKQIHEEVESQSRPKYLAHQLAILYQAIVNLPSGENVFSKHKKNLEENFPILKRHLAELSEDGESLSSEVREWVLDFTDSLMQGIRSMPSAMTRELLPLAMSFTSMSL